MAQKWNLQDIRPAGTQKQPPRDVGVRRPQQDIAPRATKPEPVQAFDDSDLASIEIVDGNGVKKKRVVITAIAALIIVGTGFFVNVLLGGADVTVHPKIKDVSVQANITAYTEPQVGELGYELLSLESVGEKQVKAAGKEAVSEKASGKIFVYNTKSTSPQRLIKNTRFESKDGHIFRIQESIEVPGASKDAKGNLVPGKVVADVFADGPGEQYNLPPGRFTVPGLKGSEQYDSVYGESTAAFTGGFEGEKYIIDENELATAKQALHIELRNALLEKLKAERPAGFIVYDNAVTFAFDSLPSTEYGDSLATIKEKARLQVPIFKEAEFAEFLAKKTVPDYTGEPITLLDPTTLSFEYTSGTTTISDIASYTALDFILKGTTRLVWKFDEAKLKNDLLGMKKSDATTVFAQYPSISNAQAEIRPFWSTSFPDDAKSIDVHTVLEPK